MAGSVGAGRALETGRNEAEALQQRFPKHFLRRGEALLQEEERLGTDLLAGCQAEYVQRFEGKSILSALWDLGIALESGLETEMSAFPISQYTIELSELFGLNPYEEAAGNGALLVTEAPEEVVELLTEAGVTAAVIGHLTDGIARTANTAEGVRYLNPER